MRSRRTKAHQYMHVALDVICARRHKVGMAWKYAPEDPREGYRVSRLTFTETENGGKIESVCTRCGDHVQIRWSPVRDALDAAEREGRHAGGTVSARSA